MATMERGGYFPNYYGEAPGDVKVPDGLLDGKIDFLATHFMCNYFSHYREFCLCGYEFFYLSPFLCSSDSPLNR